MERAFAVQAWGLYVYTPQRWSYKEAQQILLRIKPLISVRSQSFGMLVLRRSSDTGQGSSRPESAQQEAAPTSASGGSSLDASNAAPHRSTSGIASSPVASSELIIPVPKAEEQKGPSKSPAAQPTAGAAKDIAAAVSSSSQDGASPEASGKLEATSGPKPGAQPAKGALTVPEEGCSPSEPIKAGLGEAKGAASSENTNGHPTPEPNALPASNGKAKHSPAQEPSTLSGAGSAPKTAQTHTAMPKADSAEEPASAAEESPFQVEPTAVGGQAVAGTTGAMPATPAATPDEGSAPKTAQTHTPMPKAMSAKEPASAAGQRPSHDGATAVDGETAAGAMGAMPASANGTAEPTQESLATKDAANGAPLSESSTAAARVTTKTPHEKTPPTKTPPEETPAAQDVKEAKVSVQESCRPLS